MQGCGKASWYVIKFSFARHIAKINRRSDAICERDDMTRQADQQSVYIFRDERYSHGAKVGKGRIISCLHDAAGYSPGVMLCVGFWCFSNSREAYDAEKSLHDHLRQRGIHHMELPNSDVPRNGTEWFDLCPSEAVKIGDRFFRRTHDIAHLSGTRQDKVLSRPSREGRLLLWIYEECITKQIKINTCSEFKSPTEQRRRYSRNGYQQVAAFSIDPPFTLEGNQMVFQAREDTISYFGESIGKGQFGWLSRDLKLQEVVHYLSKIPSLVRITDIETRPVGTRPSYTGAKCHIPTDELRFFPDPWWG